MTEQRFNIGDEVTVRQWEDMAEEYGYRTPSKSVIDIPFNFILEMKDFCGKRFTIEDKRWNPVHECYAYYLRGGADWKFSEQMFEESKDLYLPTENVSGSTIAELFSGGGAQ